jgi:hypothetical protein
VDIGKPRDLLLLPRQRRILIEDGVSGGSEEASTGVMRIRRRATVVQGCVLTVFFWLFYSVPSPRRQVWL